MILGENRSYASIYTCGQIDIPQKITLAFPIQSSALIINTSSWNTSVYTGMGFITVYNGMSVITTKSLNKLHFNKILQSANIFQNKKNSSCSLLIYRLVEITNYFCTLKSVDIYSIVKTVG